MMQPTGYSLQDWTTWNIFTRSACFLCIVGQSEERYSNDQDGIGEYIGYGLLAVAVCVICSIMVVTLRRYYLWIFSKLIWIYICSQLLCWFLQGSHETCLLIRFEVGFSVTLRTIRFELFIIFHLSALPNFTFFASTKTQPQSMCWY